MRILAAMLRRTLLAAVWIGPAFTLACAGIAPETLEERARRIHRESIVIDTHADTTPRFLEEGWEFTARHPKSDSHVDLPRMREGGLDAQFWSVYTGKAKEPGEAMRIALQRIDAVHRLVQRHPEETALATTAAELRAVVGTGRVASLMGVEGGHMIEDDLAVLRSYHRLGVRYLTLTHSFHTSWADSSGTTSVLEPEHGGLTPFGEDVIREMNRLGMMVDVSHVSDDTFYDVLRVTRAPVIASHSSCRAVADHPRNMTDDMLQALAANGGVVMINFYPSYIDEDANAATRAYFEEWKETFAEMREQHAGDRQALGRARRAHLAAHPVPQVGLDRLLDHFDHAIAVAGPEAVGLGSDWDGVPSMPEGLDEVSLLPNLSVGLLERGHSEETLRKVLGENLLRVMEQVERVAAAPAP